MPTPNPALAHTWTSTRLKLEAGLPAWVSPISPQRRVQRRRSRLPACLPIPLGAADSQHQPPWCSHLIRVAWLDDHTRGMSHPAPFLVHRGLWESHISPRWLLLVW